jgi:hypothetical protein
MTHQRTVWNPKQWILNVLIGLDQWIGTWFGGHPDETISSAAGRAKRAGHLWGRVLCRILDWLDPGHCEKSIERVGTQLDLFTKEHGHDKDS